MLKLSDPSIASAPSISDIPVPFVMWLLSKCCAELIYHQPSLIISPSPLTKQFASHNLSQLLDRNAHGFSVIIHNLLYAQQALSSTQEYTQVSRAIRELSTLSLSKSLSTVAASLPSKSEQLLTAPMFLYLASTEKPNKKSKSKLSTASPCEHHQLDFRPLSELDQQLSIRWLSSQSAQIFLSSALPLSTALVMHQFSCVTIDECVPEAMQRLSTHTEIQHANSAAASLMLLLQMNFSDDDENEQNGADDDEKEAQARKSISQIFSQIRQLLCDHWFRIASLLIASLQLSMPENCEPVTWLQSVHSLQRHLCCVLAVLVADADDEHWQSLISSHPHGLLNICGWVLQQQQQSPSVAMTASGVIQLCNVMLLLSTKFTNPMESMSGFGCEGLYGLPQFTDLLQLLPQASKPYQYDPLYESVSDVTQQTLVTLAGSFGIKVHDEGDDEKDRQPPEVQVSVHTEQQMPKYRNVKKQRK